MGPKRDVDSHQGNIHVTALELQADQNEVATRLTGRCSMDARVDHVCGDFLDYDFSDQRFDAIVSWLARMRRRRR
jgi:tRNA A58 N-methylase Trm61